MLDFFDFLLDFIRIDILFSFGYYSLIFFILKWISFKKEYILDFDNFACKLVVYLGILFTIVWILSIFYYYFVIANEVELKSFADRLTGTYSFGIWLQPLFWLILTQLLRINFFKNSFIFRIVISFSFVITFERFAIIMTSLDRDYLPLSWSFGFSWLELLLSFPLRIFEFIFVVLIFKNSSNLIKNQFANLRLK
jgi:hypothetical protein